MNITHENEYYDHDEPEYMSERYIEDLKKQISINEYQLIGLKQLLHASIIRFYFMGTICIVIVSTVSFWIYANIKIENLLESFTPLINTIAVFLLVILAEIILSISASFSIISSSRVLISRQIIYINKARDELEFSPKDISNGGYYGTKAR